MIYLHATHFKIRISRLFIWIRILKQLSRWRLSASCRTTTHRRRIQRRSLFCRGHSFRRFFALRRILHLRGSFLDALIGRVPRERDREVHVHAVRFDRLVRAVEYRVVLDRGWCHFSGCRGCLPEMGHRVELVGADVGLFRVNELGVQDGVVLV